MQILYLFYCVFYETECKQRKYDEIIVVIQQCNIEICLSCLRTSSTCDLVALTLLEGGQYQFVVYKPLSYYVNQIWRRGLVRKASSVASYQTRCYNWRMLTKDYSLLWDFSWTENYKLTWLVLFTWWCYFTTRDILEQTWNCGSVSPNNWFSQCRFQWIKRDGS